MGFANSGIGELGLSSERRLRYLLEGWNGVISIFPRCRAYLFFMSVDKKWWYQ